MDHISSSASPPPEFLSPLPEACQVLRRDHVEPQPGIIPRPRQQGTSPVLDDGSLVSDRSEDDSTPSRPAGPQRQTSDTPVGANISDSNKNESPVGPGRRRVTMNYFSTTEPSSSEVDAMLRSIKTRKVPSSSSAIMDTSSPVVSEEPMPRAARSRGTRTAHISTTDDSDSGSGLFLDAGTGGVKSCSLGADNVSSDLEPVARPARRRVASNRRAIVEDDSVSEDKPDVDREDTAFEDPFDSTDDPESQPKPSIPPGEVRAPLSVDPFEPANVLEAEEGKGLRTARRGSFALVGTRGNPLELSSDSDTPQRRQRFSKHSGRDVHARRRVRAGGVGRVGGGTARLSTDPLSRSSSAVNLPTACAAVSDGGSTSRKRQRSSSSSHSGGTNEKRRRHGKAQAEEPPLAVAATTEPSRVALNEEQRMVLNSVVAQRKSIFFTGAAGTGKSVLMRHIIQKLRSILGNKGQVAVTASTGLAAYHIGGTTLHAFSGLPINSDDVDYCFKTVRANKQARERWQNVEALIIDEISMINATDFDILSQVAQRIRRGKKSIKDSRPWGGIQLIVAGDFYQLPPCRKGGSEPMYAFSSKTWHEVFQKGNSVFLSQVFRQKDPEFAEILSEIRLGKMSSAGHEMAIKLNRELDPRLRAPRLFCRNKGVDEYNNRELGKLEGSRVTFDSKDTCGKGCDRFLGDLPGEARVDLKVGAQVLLLKNLDDVLVNGSAGVVIGFSTVEDWGECEIVGETSGDGELERGEDTISASSPVVDLDLEWRKITGQAMRDRKDERFPVVEFEVRGQVHKVLCARVKWTVDVFTVEGRTTMATRWQVPLRLGWALTIHKSQGMTLEHLVVNVGETFEYGQAYVAVSRATSMSGLQAKGLRGDSVKASAAVSLFYKSLKPAGSLKPVTSILEYTERM